VKPEFLTKRQDDRVVGADGLDLAVADLSDVLERFIRMVGNELSHSIELETEWAPGSGRKSGRNRKAGEQRLAGIAASEFVRHELII
jgi:hypothetical protein